MSHFHAAVLKTIDSRSSVCLSLSSSATGVESFPELLQTRLQVATRREASPRHDAIVPDLEHGTMNV